MSGFIYILASGRNGTLYVGVTSELRRRIWEHREKIFPGFTQQNDLARLVYYEQHASIGGAIHREKQVKRWPRLWKLELIESMNPNWDDLYDSLNS